MGNFKARNQHCKEPFYSNIKTRIAEAGCLENLIVRKANWRAVVVRDQRKKK